MINSNFFFVRLSAVKVGSHIANQTANNFSYADGMALVAPSAVAFNELLKIY